MKTAFVKLHLTLIACGLLGIIATTSDTTAQNLLANPTFSAGNTGFVSDYVFNNPNNTEGEYTVGANPNAWNPGLVSAPPWTDHTPTGDNLSMLVNGSPTAGLAFWRQTVSVSANTDYVFSGWVSDIFPGPNSSRGSIQLYVGATAIGAPFNFADGEPNWQQFTRVFNSGAATSITVSLRDLNTSTAANDFAVDDLSLVPEPSALMLTLLGAGCCWSTLPRRPKPHRP